MTSSGGVACWSTLPSKARRMTRNSGRSWPRSWARSSRFFFDASPRASETRPFRKYNRNGLVSLARGDASKKKRHDLAQERGHDLPEFLVMRRAFEGRVDQQATPPLLVIQGSFNDFLQERDNRIS